MSLLAAFAEHLTALGLEPGRVLVAVSGGPDSVALLDLLVATRDRHRLELVVAHADHGIHPASESVARQVERLAASYGVPCIVGRLELGPDAGETAARRARLAWLESVRREQDAHAILTAHQADDQTETVLMRVLRGSGPAGLAAIASHQGVWVRPLLPFRRETLARYVQTQGLQVWDDPANRDLRHLRSWIRMELLPRIRERFPDVDRQLRGVARQAALDRAAWDALLDQQVGLDYRLEPEGCSVAAPVLEAYDWPLAVALVQAVGRRVGCNVGPRRAARTLRFLRTAASGAVLELGGGWRLELGFDRLLFIGSAAARVPPLHLLDGDSGRERWGEWMIEWTREPAPAEQSRSGYTAWFVPQPIVVRAWRTGERIRPLGGPGRRLLARCFQEARVPRSRRGSWPVLDAAGHAVWVPGVCRAHEQLPAPGSPALRIDVGRV